MKANLMFRDGRKFGKPEFNFAAGALKTDLELGRIMEYMAKGDRAIYNACEDVLLRPLQSKEEIEYRQQTLADALQNPDAVRRLYAIAAETDRIKKFYLSPSRLAETYTNAVELLKIYTNLLVDLREVADKCLNDFTYEAFKNLLDMLKKELPDEYFDEIHNQLDEMKNVNNILVSAKLGSNLQSVGYTLRRKEKGFWLRWRLARSFTADAERDPAELDDLYMRRDRAISEAASIMTQSAQFLEGFFAMLREDLAFYVGCLNLSDKMREFGLPVCVPKILPIDSMDRSWHGLYDVSLALTKGTAVVGNDLDAAKVRLYIVSGANQGGKSTFLRSIGQAQLMAQCGMFVGADSFTAPIRRGVFSHFKREEDAFMKSGRLDEELDRMKTIIDSVQRGSMLLFNESFSSTNEREGSEICRQITQALVENGMEVFSVTHLYTYAASFLGDTETKFLRAQRNEDAERTFKILPGDPLETAFGDDLYQKIFVQAGMTM